MLSGLFWGGATSVCIAYGTLFMGDFKTMTIYGVMALAVMFGLWHAAAYAASIALTPGNMVLDSGQTATFNMLINSNGIGPFNVQLYNVTGNAAQGANTVIVQPYDVNSTSSPTAYIENTVIAPDDPLYLCEAGADWTFSSADQYSWTPDTNTYSGYYGGNITSIGHQTGNECTANTTGSFAGLAVAGIGLNDNAPYTVYADNNIESYTQPTQTFQYNVDTANSFVVIMITTGSGKISLSPSPFVDYPGNPLCKQVAFTSADPYDGAYIGECANQAIGPHIVTATVETGHTARLPRMYSIRRQPGIPEMCPSRLTPCPPMSLYSTPSRRISATSRASPRSRAHSAVNNAPTLSELTPSNTVFDFGQPITYNVLLQGGTGPSPSNLSPTSDSR